MYTLPSILPTWMVLPILPGWSKRIRWHGISRCGRWGSSGVQRPAAADVDGPGGRPPSVYREIQRAEQGGLITSRKISNTRLVRADTASPCYGGLAEILTRAFGVPAVLTEALRDVNGITAAYIYGSWAARHHGQPGQRPVGDIDVLILGEPDRDQLYAALSTAEQRLARPVQATIRDTAWLESGSGAFHNTITSRPLLRLAVPSD